MRVTWPELEGLPDQEFLGVVAGWLEDAPRSVDGTADEPEGLVGVQLQLSDTLARLVSSRLRQIGQE